MSPRPKARLGNHDVHLHRDPDGANEVSSTVAYTTNNGTATAGATCPGAFDFETSSGTLTFAVGVTTQTITVNVCKDALFEANETFSITLSSPTNATIGDATGAGSITNDDASNSAPTDIALSNNTIAENAGANATVGTLSTTDPNVGDTFTYTLVAGTGSTGNGSFNISGNTLRATASLDFEAQSSYSVRIRTTDQGGLFFEEAFTITVTNVNETPTDIALSPSSIAENAGANATVGTLSTTDPDAGNTFTYTLVAGTGSTGNGSFNISGNTLRATASLDFEAQSSYSVRIRTTDQGGLFFEEAFTITVTNVNEAPTVTLDPGNQLSVVEGSQHTYLFSVSDVDAGDTFTVVSVSCGANGSQVGSTTTTASGGSFVCLFPDGPATSIVSIQVKDAANANSNVATQSVAIANVAPTVTLTGSATANEGNQLTYSFSTSDPGADTFVLDTTSCGTNGSQIGLATFNSTTGAGSFVCSFPDGPASSTVSVTVSDSDGASDSDSIVVAIANVKPSIALSGDATADEGTTHTYSFTVTDPGQDPTRHDRLRPERRQGQRLRHVRPGDRSRQLRLLLRRRPGHDQRDRHRDRLRRRLGHRQPGRRRDGQQRRPDRDPRQQRPDQRGLERDGQLHGSVRPVGGRHDRRLHLQLRLQQRRRLHRPR